MINPIGRVFKALRKKRQYTQNALAREINVSASLISHWETDRARPTPRQEDAFLSRLNVEEEEFYAVYLEALLALDKNRQQQTNKQD